MRKARFISIFIGCCLWMGGCSLTLPHWFAKSLPPGDSMGRKDTKVHSIKGMRDEQYGWFELPKFPSVTRCVDGEYTGKHIRELKPHGDLPFWSRDDGGKVYAFSVPDDITLGERTMECRAVFNLYTDKDDIVTRCIWDRFPR